MVAGCSSKHNLLGVCGSAAEDLLALPRARMQRAGTASGSHAAVAASMPARRSAVPSSWPASRSPARMPGSATCSPDTCEEDSTRVDHPSPIVQAICIWPGTASQGAATSIENYTREHQC